MSERIAVFGAGAIGCYIGGLWTDAGLDVVFIGRERLAREIGAHGLHLTDHAGGDIRLPPERVSFATDPAAMREATQIIVTVKSTATEDAAAEIDRHAAPDAAVLSLQNGISNMTILREALPGRGVLRGMVGFNVAHMGNGRWHRGTSGLLAAEDHPRLKPLAEKLAGHAGHLELMADMEALAWGKLLLNLNNAVNALSGKTLLAQLSERPYRRVLAASQREALGVLKAARIRPARVGPLPPRLVPTFVAAPDVLFNTVGLRLQKIDAHARSSMADDFAAGRPSEIDFLNGEIVRLAERRGVPAPVNATIVELVKEAEAGGRRNWPGEEFAARVLA